MATAIGCCTPPIVAAVRDVAGEEPNRRPRLISETVLEVKFATIATPVASLTATPIGFVPTATAATGCVLVRRLTIETLLLPLLATTAKPRRGLTAIPWGVVPTAIELSTDPNVGLAGLMSMVEILLHPLFVTTASGEKFPWAS